MRAAAGFDIGVEGTPPTTPASTAEQLAIIARLDPHGKRRSAFAGDPPASAIKQGADKG